LSQAFRVLRVTFDSREELEREYEANLVNGGLFIPGHLELLYGEPVMVWVDLPFIDKTVELEGRVVQTIPIEFEANGGRSGVALEMSDTPEEIRECFEAALGAPLVDERSRGEGQRHAPRSVAHVRARVRVAGVSEIEGHTRNLSLAGVLVAITEEPPPIGQDVAVAIVHPTTGEERELPGSVARHDLDDTGHVRGIGIQFAIPRNQADETIAYLNAVKASEHARRLGGITGSIDTLGLADLILSFGQCVPSGRFTLMNRGEVGIVHVANGMMMSAQMGAAIGIKALVRMANWEDGNFEFHANLGPDEDAPVLGLPIEAALIEAARFVDESGAGPRPPLPGHAGLRIEHSQVDLSDPALGKIETQVLDLAGVGLAVDRMRDTIQEPDRAIDEAILRLIDEGIVRLESTD